MIGTRRQRKVKFKLRKETQRYLAVEMFKLPSREPIIYSWGFAAAFGFEMEDLQKRHVHSCLERRAIYERGLSFGRLVEKGTEPMPAWASWQTREVEVLG